MQQLKFEVTNSERTSGRRTAVYAAILFSVFLCTIITRSQFLLADGDTFWHLVVGRNILQAHLFPLVDSYSYTRAGAPWIAKEWLSQVILYVAYSTGGWRGLALFTATIAALSYSILFVWLCRRLEPIVALTLTTVTASLGMGSLLARPQIFFYLLLTLCTCGLVGAVEKRSTPWWLTPLVAVWANLHASFPIALFLAGLFGLEAVASAAPGQRARTAAKWMLAIIAALVATGATPYGYEPLRVSLRLVGSTEINAIDEWRPLHFDSKGVYGLVFIAGSLSIVAAARAGWTRAAPLLFSSALMIMHVRFFPLFAIVAAPALATPLATLFPRFARRPDAQLAALPRVAAAALAVAVLATVLVLSFAPKPVPAARMTPSAALAAAENLRLSGPVFNDYSFGGYLIFKGIRPFIDSRAELYLGGLFEKTREAELGENPAAFQSLLDEYHVTWALLEHGSEGAEKLRLSNGWVEKYADDTASVFVRN
jgi:hypothetical protein